MKKLKIFYFSVLWVCLAYGQGRVVGGSNTDITKVPWQVSLHYKGQHLCGGAILNKDYIITAAHCVDNRAPNDFKVYAGFTNQSNLPSAAQVRMVCYYTKHPSFSKPYCHTITAIPFHYPDSDVAIIKLSAPLCLAGNKAKAIELANATDETNFRTTHKKGIVSGWGALFSGGAKSNALQSAQVPIIPNSSVTAYNSYRNCFNSATMLAAGYMGGGIDTCQGDSGGPFAIKDGNIWKLVGITSWGKGCARPNYPGIYTRVSYYYGWIISKTKINKKKIKLVGSMYPASVYTLCGNFEIQNLPSCVTVNWSASVGLEVTKKTGTKTNLKRKDNFGGTGTIVATLSNGLVLSKKVTDIKVGITASVSEVWGYDWSGLPKKVERLEVRLTNVAPVFLEVGISVSHSGRKVYALASDSLIIDYPVGTFFNTRVDIDVVKGLDACGNDITKRQIFPNKTFYLSAN